MHRDEKQALPGAAGRAGTPHAQAADADGGRRPTCSFLAMTTERLKLISSDPRIMELKNCSAHTRSKLATWIPYSQAACNGKEWTVRRVKLQTQETLSSAQSKKGNETICHS